MATHAKGPFVQLPTAMHVQQMIMLVQDATQILLLIRLTIHVNEQPAQQQIAMLARQLTIFVQDATQITS